MVIVRIMGITKKEKKMSKEINVKKKMSKNKSKVKVKLS